MNATRAIRAQSDVKRAVGVLALAPSLTLIVWPLLFQLWLHADYDRFLWILTQPQPCASFGGMVVQASWTLGPALAGVAGVIAVSLTGLLRPSVSAAIVLAAAMTIALAAFMLLLPSPFARAIGC